LHAVRTTSAHIIAMPRRRLVASARSRITAVAWPASALRT
jgi:hypothetical protein